MKVTMKIDTKEIKAMVRAHLLSRGFEVSDDDITIDKKGAVSVEVEAALEVAIPSAPPPPPSAQQQTVVGVDAAPAPLPGPLRSIDGGQQPADMTFVHAANSKLMNHKEGLYPKPTQTLIEGESFDYPGDDR